MFTFDLKSGYHHIIDINSMSQSFLGCEWGGKGQVLQVHSIILWACNRMLCIYKIFEAASEILA